MKPNYEQMKNLIFARGVIPDGYNGKTADVGFALHDGEVYTVAWCGYFRSGISANNYDQAINALRKRGDTSHLKKIIDIKQWS